MKYLPALCLSAVVAFAALWEPRPKEDMAYCPHPRTWLNQKRWEDEGLVKPPMTPEEEAKEKERLFWAEKLRQTEEAERREMAEFDRKLREAREKVANA